MPPALGLGRADFSASLYASLVGLEPPVTSRTLEPNIVLNEFTLPSGSFSATLLGSRVTYTLSPLLFASALVQYNSSSHTTRRTTASRQ